MKITYDEILNEMKNAFFNKCGKNFDSLSDVGLRLQAVASELYSLSCYGDYILKQAFPQTANGEYLDKHAQLRNTERKSESKARVVLRFSIPEPRDSEVLIPAGTICACWDKPYIQFATVSPATINVGSTGVNISAEALSSGREYNVAENKITVMVNPPTGVSSVNNNKRADGGCDEESDEMLRQRLVNSYSVPASGLTLKSMAEVVEKLDEVLECKVFKNNSTLSIYVRTASNDITGNLRTAIVNCFGFADMLGLGISLSCARPVLVSLSAHCKLNSSRNDSTIAKIKSIVDGAISANGIGNSLDFEELAHKCLKLEEVEQISFNCDEAENGIIPVSNNEYLCLENFEVIVNE